MNTTTIEWKRGPHTICGNVECPSHETCKFNIWTDKRPCPDGHSYMSQKATIYQTYVNKCKAEGREPLSSNEHWG